MTYFRPVVETELDTSGRRRLQEVRARTRSVSPKPLAVTSRPALRRAVGEKGRPSAAGRAPQHVGNLLSRSPLHGQSWSNPEKL